MSVLRYLPRFRNLHRELDRMAARESWTREQLQAWQLERINRVWRHAIEHVPHYRSLRSDLSLPSEFGSISEYTSRVPTLSKQFVRDHTQQLLSVEALAGKWCRTGGSTGVPTAVYWSHEAHHEMLRAKYRSEQAYGVRVFDPKVFFWGHSGSFAPGWSGWMQRLRRPMEDRLRKRLRISAYSLGPDSLRQSLRKIERFEPVSIYGYASAIDLLAEACDRHRIELPSLKLAIMTAEPADEAMVNRVSQRFGCPAAVEYGAVECGLMAYRMPEGRIRTRDDMVLIETIPTAIDSASVTDSRDENAHQRYEIVVTVLNNPSFPLLRYRIADTTDRAWQACPTGMGMLSEIHGRANDILVTGSGRRLHSMAVKHVLEHWPEVRRFTARQNHSGKLSVVLETPERVSDQLVSTLRGKLESIMEGYDVDVATTEAIPGNLAGKHRWIISDLAAKQTIESSKQTIESCAETVGTFRGDGKSTCS